MCVWEVCLLFLIFVCLFLLLIKGSLLGIVQTNAPQVKTHLDFYSMLSYTPPLVIG